MILKCPNCRVGELSRWARFRLGNAKCRSCGAELRVATNVKVKVFVAVLEQIAFWIALYIGFAQWEWWVMGLVVVVSVIISLLVYMASPWERVRN